MHKQLSTEQLQALNELATLAGGALRSITLARICDKCHDEEKEASPYGVTDGDGKYWHHLCNECWEELFFIEEGEAQPMTQEDMNAEIGHRFRMIRIKRGYTLVQVAFWLNSRASSLSDLELGKTGITLWRLQQLATVYQVEPWVILHPDWDSLTEG
jgi:hypothetical protein